MDDILLVDDASRHGTVDLACRLGLWVFVPEKNRGYGGNQKTCYTEAMKLGADIMSMVHPDHQYDPRVIPGLVTPLLSRECDAVFGSRMLGGRPIEGGMPWWKYLANLYLTAFENETFYMYLTEYHSGLRDYSRRYLDSVNFMANSNDFVFVRRSSPRESSTGCGSAKSPSKPAISRKPRWSGSVGAPSTACRVTPSSSRRGASGCGPPFPGERSHPISQLSADIDIVRRPAYPRRRGKDGISR